MNSTTWIPTDDRISIPGLDSHECDPLFGGRRKFDYIDPAPELAGEGGLREWNRSGRHPLATGVSRRFHAWLEERIPPTGSTRSTDLRSRRTNTTGQFSMALFDNGDDRVFPSGVTCGATGAPPCLQHRTASSTRRNCEDRHTYLSSYGADVFVFRRKHCRPEEWKRGILRIGRTQRSGGRRLRSYTG